MNVLHTTVIASFVQMYGDIVLGMETLPIKEDIDPFFEAIIRDVKSRCNIKLDK